MSAERDFEEDNDEKASGSNIKDDSEPIPEPKMGPELQVSSTISVKSDSNSIS